MRITNKMIANRMLATITSNRELSAKIQLDISTTRKLRRPSDDPVGLVQIERLKGLVSRNEQFGRNLTIMQDFMTNSISAMDSALEHLETAKDIATRASSGTLSAEAKQSLAEQVDRIIDAMVDIGNTRYRNRYLFAGNLTTGTAPFSRSGDTVTYSGNDEEMKGKIGFQAEVTYNKTGTEFFNPSGGTDIFGELITLKQALETNDENAIPAQVTALNDAIAQVISLSADVGALQQRLDSTEQLIENENIHFADSISKIQDTDMVEAIVNSKIIENAINSGLSAMADIVQRSLMDFVS